MTDLDNRLKKNMELNGGGYKGECEEKGWKMWLINNPSVFIWTDILFSAFHLFVI